jgi:predicted phage-related endonuclease
MAEAEFWEMVTNRVSPPVDGSDSTADTLARRYPEDDGVLIDLPNEAIQWDQDRLESVVERDSAVADIQDIDNHIKDLMGDASIGMLPDGSGMYTWKTQERAGKTFRVFRRAAARTTED